MPYVQARLQVFADRRETTAPCRVGCSGRTPPATYCRGTASWLTVTILARSKIACGVQDTVRFDGQISCGVWVMAWSLGFGEGFELSCLGLMLMGLTAVSHGLTVDSDLGEG